MSIKRNESEDESVIKVWHVLNEHTRSRHEIKISEKRIRDFAFLLPYLASHDFYYVLSVETAILKPRVWLVWVDFELGKEVEVELLPDVALVKLCKGVFSSLHKPLLRNFDK